MTAALVISLVLNVALLVTVVCIAVLFSRSLQTAVQLTDRVHLRAVKSQDGLLDRIMSADWHSFREARSEDLAEEGGQIFPTAATEEDGEFLVTQLSDEELRQMAHERSLITEDFPDENR